MAIEDPWGWLHPVIFAYFLKSQMAGFLVFWKFLIKTKRQKQINFAFYTSVFAFYGAQWLNYEFILFVFSLGF